MKLVALAVVLAACNGTAERGSATPTAPGTGGNQVGEAPHPGPGSGRTPVDPGPPDCAALVPAVDRITEAEVAEIRRTRPPEIAPIAEAEVTAVGVMLDSVLPRLCVTDKWSGAYTACVTAAKVRDDARACTVHLGADQRTHLEEAMAAAAKPSGTLGIPECDEWEQLMTRIQACDKFPPESREAVRQAIAQSMNTWRQSATTPEMRASIATACKSASDAMKSSLTSIGCQ